MDYIELQVFGSRKWIYTTFVELRWSHPTSVPSLAFIQDIQATNGLRVWNWRRGNDFKLWWFQSGLQSWKLEFVFVFVGGFYVSVRTPVRVETPWSTRHCRIPSLPFMPTMTIFIEPSHLAWVSPELHILHGNEEIHLLGHLFQHSPQAAQDNHYSTFFGFLCSFCPCISQSSLGGIVQRSCMDSTARAVVRSDPQLLSGVQKNGFRVEMEYELVVYVWAS